MSSELKEGIHYYTLPNGLLVFTEKYHLERGYCCKNGCLHCPYGFKKKSEQALLFSVLSQCNKPDNAG